MAKIEFLHSNQALCTNTPHGSSTLNIYDPVISKLKLDILNFANFDSTFTK